MKVKVWTNRWLKFFKKIVFSCLTSSTPNHLMKMIITRNFTKTIIDMLSNLRRAQPLWKRILIINTIIIARKPLKTFISHWILEKVKTPLYPINKTPLLMVVKMITQAFIKIRMITIKKSSRIRIKTVLLNQTAKSNSRVPSSITILWFKSLRSWTLNPYSNNRIPLPKASIKGRLWGKRRMESVWAIIKLPHLKKRIPWWRNI